MCQPIRGYGLVGHSSRPYCSGTTVAASTVARIGLGVPNLHKKRLYRH
jgi:hypothetical protein